MEQLQGKQSGGSRRAGAYAKTTAAQEQPATETKPEDEEDYFANLMERCEPTAQEPTPEQPAALHFNSLAEYEAWEAGLSQQERDAYSEDDLMWLQLGGTLPKRAAKEPAAQEPGATNPEPGPAALVFNSLAEYKRWAASASQQERESYWNSLSDFDWQCLWDDLDDEAAAHGHAPVQPGQIRRRGFTVI